MERICYFMANLHIKYTMEDKGIYSFHLNDNYKLSITTLKLVIRDNFAQIAIYKNNELINETIIVKSYEDFCNTFKDLIIKINNGII